MKPASQPEVLFESTSEKPMRKRTLRHFRRRTPPGAPPGVLIADPEASPPRIQVFAYGPDHLHEQVITDLCQLANLLQQWPVLWVDIEGLGNAETIKTIGEMFSLHRLALEDV